jgi:putative protease
LARELNIKEIKEIKEKVSDIELEVFVHGAMCMSYSGRCLL